jgi:hypothetical protein
MLELRFENKFMNIETEEVIARSLLPRRSGYRLALAGRTQAMKQSLES